MSLMASPRLSHLESVSAPRTRRSPPTSPAPPLQRILFMGGQSNKLLGEGAEYSIERAQMALKGPTGS